MNTKITACLFSALLLSQSVYPMSLDTISENNKKENVIKSQWKGKKVAILGDSISDKNRIGTKKCWWETLAENLSFTPYVYAVNGNQWDGIYSQLEKLKKEKGNDFDAILILAGTNDYNASIPIGNWFIEEKAMTEVENKKTEMRNHRDFIMSNGTFKGRINRALSYIKENFPTKQVILITPIHRAFAKFSEGNVQPNEMFPNKSGKFIDEYINTIKEASNVWSVPVIDLNGTCGLFPLYDSNIGYFHDKYYDRLHPNADGHNRMALTIQYQMLSYPASFE